MERPPIGFDSPSPAGMLPGAGRAQFGQASASAMGMKWAALHEAASVVAMLVGEAAPQMPAEVRNFPALMRDTGGTRWQLAEDGIADLSAVMEPGLSALLAVHARGVNAAPAAQALWHEFLMARDALLTLAPPPATTGPKRFA